MLKRCQDAKKNSICVNKDSCSQLLFSRLVVLAQSRGYRRRSVASYGLNPATFSLEVRAVSCVLWEPRQTCAATGQDYFSGLPFHPPVDLPDHRIEPGCSALQADSLPSEPPGKALLK